MENIMDFFKRMPNTFGMYFCTFTCSFFMLVHVMFLGGATGPKDFVKGDPLTVEVQRLASMEITLSYSYYSLPYCIPKNIVDHDVDLDEFLSSARIAVSPYEFKMGEPQMCNVVCRTILDAKDAKELKERIDDDYRVNMILDNVPLVMPYNRSYTDNDYRVNMTLDNLLLVTPYNRSYTDSSVYQHGFPVGVKVQYGGKLEHKYFINNHLTFSIKYHKDEETGVSRIVGFEVKPFSVKHEYECKNDTIRLKNCTVTGNDSGLEVEDGKEIIFTYDVEFQESEIKWASRSDAFLYMVDDEIHILSFLTLCYVIPIHPLLVALNALWGISKDEQLEAQEKTEWISVLGNIFRPPTNSNLLCVFAGTGVQFFGTIIVAMVIAALGGFISAFGEFLSPSFRGELMTALPSIWAFMGLFAGYTSASLHKMFNGNEWKKIALKTSFLFPGTVFAILFILNALSWGKESSGAIPFGAMFALVLKWFCVSLPLVFVGSYVGFKKPAIKGPLKTNEIPRKIPQQAWFMNPVLNILIGGILPYSVVSVELFFIITSIWLHHFYCQLEFLFQAFLLLIPTCVSSSVLHCYLQLRGGDYLWWWRSFLTSGSSALYLFLYATYYYTQFKFTEPVPAVVYFGYALVGSFAFFVLAGTVGFLGCFWCTKKYLVLCQDQLKVEAFGSRV